MLLDIIHSLPLSNPYFAERSISLKVQKERIRLTLEITRLRAGDGRHNYPFLCWRVTVEKTGGSNSTAPWVACRKA
jgi:hypothetical protein